jgi:hypothetical protein
MPMIDLDLRVKTDVRSDRTQVSYILQSPSGTADFTYREILGPLLPRRPEEYQAYLVRKISGLGEGRDIDGPRLQDAEIERKLAKIGRDLYLELFPPEMRQAYREIRRQGVQTLRIISDEPWIPWELIKPYDDSQPGEILDDEFLCLQFELTRWLAGGRPPRSEIRVRRLACILTATDLPKVAEEKAILAELAAAWPGVEDASPALGSATAAESFLEHGGCDLLHFAGHGIVARSNPNESGLPFPDESVLRPQDLQGPLRTRIGRDRPLVFLNACSTGQQGWSLTRLGGWADRWVRICGCGAFVAPMWPVRDSLAVEFARAFYRALAGGRTFGQAGLDARTHVRQLRPGDPSWLAYSIYADVHGELVLGDTVLATPRREPRAVPPEIRNQILDFGPLIAGKTQAFVGREWLFDAVDSFVAKEQSGYVLILGDPGIGKTTLIAEMVRRHGYPHHFNVRSEGIGRPEQFLPSICAQLVARFALGHSKLPPETARDATFLRTLLEEVAGKLRPERKKLVLLVDALDETDPQSIPRGANPLYLPAHLPAGVFLVATSRRGPFRPQHSCPEHVIDLETESENNFADVRLFAESWLGREGIRTYLETQHLGETAFLDELVRLSQGNFMYLHHVLPEIERGAYATRSFAALPAGLHRYYEDHWCRMRDGAPGAWFDYKLPVLVTLSVAREPISIDLISAFSRVEGRARIQAVLDEWAPFLHASEVPEGDKVSTRYRLYHESFHDFIAGKDQVKGERVDLEEANRSVADTLWRELFPEQ